MPSLSPPSPTASAPTRPLAILIAVTIVAGVLLLARFATEATSEGRAIAFSLLVGLAFGIVLQRSRFCFLCHFRDFQERRDARGVVAILVALALGALLYPIVIASWMPVIRPGALPPDAHIGPVSLALAVASLVFGIGMAISGSCLSGHLYRLGEGSPTSPFAILGALIGFGLGFLTWNWIYVAAVATAPSVWLPHHFGYEGTLALGLFVLAALILAAFWLGRPVPRAAEPEGEHGQVKLLLRRVFVERWPYSLGGAAVAVISAFAFLRVGPLGVTAELGSIARTSSAALGALPETLHGLDALRGCATAVKSAILSKNGALVGGLVAGSFAAALVAGQFTPAWPTPKQVAKGLVGGILMGWGAMTGLGCTVGVLLSGIHAGALSGWVFLVFCAIGVSATLAISRRATRATA
ncbi:membrane protein [Kaistia sp. 32K]|uniref:YeeE/YedE family protein n=1 Tax=Kaistia sp. 32K TaxID=2795690 RepID=UPI00191609D1|nr:YeeE/YedE family protein [Kaistia sp. 32K]BCP51612.1 membrane protein [Kaistia sp. 32K]